jgi:hypothetical protein
MADRTFKPRKKRGLGGGNSSQVYPGDPDNQRSPTDDLRSASMRDIDRLDPAQQISQVNGQINGYHDFDSTAEGEFQKLHQAEILLDRQLIADKCNEMDKCSFVKTQLFPQIQQLLLLPPHQAREGLIGVMSNIALQGMLFLAATIGPACDLNWKQEEVI